MKRISTILALLGICTTAQADVVCNGCEYTANVGTYLGSYWPGDRGTFTNKTIAADIGQSIQFDNRWVFDLNDNAVATLTVSTRKGTALDGLWAIEIYSDAGSNCADPSSGTRLCFSIVYGQVVGFDEDGQRAQIRTALVPGRYIIRFAGGTRAVGESAYAGKLTFGR